MIIESVFSPRAFDLCGRRKANVRATNSAKATPPNIIQRIFKKDLLVGSASDFFSFVFVGIIMVILSTADVFNNSPEAIVSYSILETRYL